MTGGGEAWGQGDVGGKEASKEEEAGRGFRQGLVKGTGMACGGQGVMML